MVQNPTIFCEVFVTDSTTPPFQNKTYSTLRSYPYKILHWIMVLIRWKCLGPVARGFKGRSKNISKQSIMTTQFGQCLLKSSGRVLRRASLSGQMTKGLSLWYSTFTTCRNMPETVASLILPNMYPKSLPDKFNFMWIKPSKNFWNKFKIPRDDLSSGLEFLTKFSKHKQIS